MGKVYEQIPAAPFAQWLNDEIKRIEADDPFRTEEKSVVPAVRILAARLDVSDRWIYRFRKSLDSYGRPTNTAPRDPVEDALERAGVPFAALYPDLVASGDVELEPDIFCESCDEMVTPIHGCCPWCTPEEGHPRRCSGCGGWKYKAMVDLCVRCERKRRGVQGPTMHNPVLKARAVALRREGLEIKAIAARLGVPQSTVGDWVCGIPAGDPLSLRESA